MSDAALRSETLSPTCGGVELTVAGVGQGTRLARLYHHDPMRVIFPFKEKTEPLTATLVNTSGGLVGGDEVTVSVTVPEKSHLRVMAQAAEKVYRSTGRDSRIDVELSVGPDGWLEWLPQETIIFDAARLRRHTKLDVAPGGRALAGEILVFGRTAHGETLNTGLLREVWDIRRDGRLTWMDALHLDGDLRAALDAPSGFHGAVACATLVLVEDEADSALRDGLRDMDLPDGVRLGVTIVNGVLVARWLADDAQQLRLAFAQAWGKVRNIKTGYPDRMPRLWNI